MNKSLGIFFFLMKKKKMRDEPMRGQYFIKANVVGMTYFLYLCLLMNIAYLYSPLVIKVYSFTIPL